MGRYVFFNTGVEYKFVFALQPSSDIVDFGGSEEGTDGENFFHEWTTLDLPFIRTKLQQLEEYHGFEKPPLDLSKYKKSPEGTSKLHLDLDDIKPPYGWSELTHQYVLGMLIAHQLSYKSPLEAKYEP
jgi:hypothetical protein